MSVQNGVQIKRRKRVKNITGKSERSEQSKLENGREIDEQSVR